MISTILLIIIYIDFIGLGIPDSLFGSAWPAIYTELGFSASDAGYVTFVISGCTMISSVCSTKVINKFGTGNVTAVSTIMTALALLGFSISKNIILLSLFSIPLGLGAGAVDSALNNYIALHYKAAHMNFLHCFYGIGVTVSPYIMSQALKASNNWREGYRFIFYIQFIIAFITIVSIPLWKKASKERQAEAVHIDNNTPNNTLVKNKSIIIVWVIFITSCAIEYTIGIWASTFFVESKGILPEIAAKYTTLYYAGMAVGRFLSGILSSKLSCWKLIHIGKYIILVAIMLFIIPMPEFIFPITMFIAGLGVGPIFPNLLHLTPINFGEESSQAAIGSQMAAAYTGIMLMPPFFGLISNYLGIKMFPLFLLLTFVVMYVMIYVFIRILKNKGRYNI